MLPLGVESKVEQYFQKNWRQPAARRASSAARAWLTASSTGTVRIQGHDQRVGLCGGFRGQRGIRHTQKLDGAHPVAAQGFGKVGAAGEIVGGCSQERQSWDQAPWGKKFGGLLRVVPRTGRPRSVR